MRKILLVLGLALLPAASPAADVGRSGHIVGRAAPAAFSWTGFYLGGTVGLGAQDDPVAQGKSGALASLFASGENAKPRGWFYGVTAGYNHQLSNRWVAGIEGDFSWSNLKASNSASISLGGLSTTTATNQKLEWLSTVRGRIGYLPWSHVMPYATAGVAFGKANVGASSTFAPGCIIGCGTAETGSTRTGWTAGGGVEIALTQAISLKGEALYYDLGSVSGAYTAPGIIPTSFTYASDVRGWIARAGVNVRF
jgi:outer membrane immunogenic protein